MTTAPLSLEQHRPGFRDGDPHGWNETWCSTVARRIRGDAAEKLLTEGPTEAGLLVLPSWVWRRSKIDVGRKDRAMDGGRLLMPIHVSWSHGPVVLVDSTEPVELTWSATGMGLDISGTTTVSLGDGPDLVDVTGSEPPAEITLSAMPPGRLERELVALKEDGQAAHWAAVQGLSRYVEIAVNKAHARLAKDVAGDPEHERPLLDQVSLEKVQDVMVLGETGADSVVMRVVDRSCDPSTFVSCDPSRWVWKKLHQAAERHVAKAVGDPAVGWKIRSVARRIGVETEADLDRLLEEYRRLYPGDKMGRWRVLDALSVRPEVSVGASPLVEDRDIA